MHLTLNVIYPLRLSEADLALPRRGFKLDAALRDRKGFSTLSPEVASWSTGQDIIVKLRERLSTLLMGRTPP